MIVNVPAIPNFFLAAFSLTLANTNYLAFAAPNPGITVYDQRQSGDLNVQLHLKDIQIVAFLDSGFFGNYGDYDYAYDYSDFTTKPAVAAPTSTAATAAISVRTSVTAPSSPSTVSQLITTGTNNDEHLPNTRIALVTTLKSDNAAGPDKNDHASSTPVPPPSLPVTTRTTNYNARASTLTTAQNLEIPISTIQNKASKIERPGSRKISMAANVRHPFPRS